MAEKKKSSVEKKKPSSTVPKKVSNKEIRKARKAAKAKVERIPEGMSRKDYADAAFRKKVTIIMGSILLAFIIGLAIFLLVVQHKYDYQGYRDEVKQALAEAGDSAEERAKVEINVTSESFNFWITTLDNSYKVDSDDPDYGCFEGATITLQGMFVKRVFAGDVVNYWVFRSHDEHGHSHSHDHDHEEDHTEATNVETTESKDTKIPTNTIGDSIEVIFDGDVDIPEDGTWVEVTGIVGVDSYGSLSAINHAEMKVIDGPTK